MARILTQQGLRIAVLAGCLSACSIVNHADRATEQALADRVDALLAPLVAANEFSGAVVLARHGQIVYQRGFGLANRSTGVPFTPDTPADGGSLAKTFTAAGVWWLAHEGKIDLDEAVIEYAPEYPHARTTVRHLLSHSNGLPPDYEFFDVLFRKDEVRTTAAMLRLVGAHAPRPSFAPGTRYEYSNLGFDAAGLVIERVTGQDYEAFVKERFLGRLDMRSSFARPARLGDWRGVRTAGYRWRDSAWVPHDAHDLEGFFGASNLYFSAADLARWGIANAAGTALPGPVFEAGQRRLTVGGLPLPVTGLSWYCDSHEVRCNYTGHHAGFHAFVYWDRERNESAAFVSNSTLPAWVAATLQRDLVNVLAGRPSDVVHSVTFEALSELEAADLAGTYEAPGHEAIALTLDRDRIKLRVGKGLEFDAYPAGGHALYVPGLDYVLAFSGGAGSRTMHVKSQELNILMRRP